MDSIEDQGDEEHNELISFGEFVTLIWAIEGDRDKKEALFAGASVNFSDVSAYKSIQLDTRPTWAQVHGDEKLDAGASLNYGVIDEEDISHMAGDMDAQGV